MSSNVLKGIPFYMDNDANAWASCKHVNDESIDYMLPPGTEFSFDLIEQPFFCKVKVEEKTDIILCYRSQLGAFTDEPNMVASISADGKMEVTKVEGNVEGDGGAEKLLMLFYASCYEIYKAAEEQSLIKDWSDLEPNEGILVGLDGETLTFTRVAGTDRPDLLCTTLFGGMEMSRPYEDEVMTSWMDEMFSDGPNIEELTEQAEEGDALAQFNLGIYYVKGEGVEQSIERALYWMEKAAENGDEDAPNHVKNYRKILELEEKAAGGDAVAMGQLANEYMAVGINIGYDYCDQYYEKSLEMAKKAETAGDLYAKWILALAYEHGRGVDYDLDTAVRYYKEGADKGEPNCQNSLACFHMQGNGVKYDENAAFILYEKAAEQGNKLATFALCKCYEFGHGTEVNLDKALEWGEKAAAFGDPVHQYEVGIIYTYEDENGKMLDEARAKYWLNESAKQGYEKADMMLHFGPMWNDVKVESEPDSITALKQKQAFVQYLEHYRWSSNDKLRASYLPEEGKAVFTVEVQGTQYEGRNDRIEYIKSGQSVAVVREPNSEHNANNLSVRNSAGQSLGNLSQHVCDYLSPLIDSGFAEIKGVKVSYVEPLSQRSKRARKSILYVELTVQIAEIPFSAEEGCVVCMLGGDQIRTWAQKLDVLKCAIPFADAKTLFELHNRYHKEYDEILSGEEPDYSYVGLDNLVEEIIDAKTKMEESMIDGLDYSSKIEPEDLGKYILTLAKDEPERYAHLMKYLDAEYFENEWNNSLEGIFERYTVDKTTYYWLDQTRVDEAEWDGDSAYGFNHWYSVAELYNPEQPLPFDLSDEDVVSIFGFNQFAGFADLSYGC